MFNKSIEIKSDKICSIVEVGEEETYDIQNFQDNCYLNESNFFADGFLVHNSGKHAGGIVILPSPVYNYIPVDRVNGEIITAFPESGSEQVLDELGICKYDILSISILDVINDAVNMINEDLFLIEDDDGIMKIISQSYIDNHISQF